MKGQLVFLSADAEDHAEKTARARQDAAGDLPDKHGAVRHKTWEDRYAGHLAGTRGEEAAAAAYHVTANRTVNTFHDATAAPDIGFAGEVRTRRLASHDLIVRRDDPDDRYYVLVTGSHVRGTPLRVIGGIWGGDAKQDRWWKNHGGYGWAWFVPQSALQAPEEIRREWI